MKNTCVVIEIEVHLLFHINWKTIMAPLYNIILKETKAWGTSGIVFFNDSKPRAEGSFPAICKKNQSWAFKIVRYSCSRWVEKTSIKVKTLLFRQGCSINYEWKILEQAIFETPKCSFNLSSFTAISTTSHKNSH